MHKIIALLFIIFAAVQYNDPDFYIWVPLYGVIAIVAIMWDRGWRNKKVLFALSLMFFLGMCFYIPDVIYWVLEGTPSIAGSMKAESPFIEFVREFFGLGICLTALTLYLRAALKNKATE